jgi:hypothetical protein
MHSATEMYVASTEEGMGAQGILEDTALDNNRVSTQHTHWVHASACVIYAAINQLPALKPLLR